jgi:predicted lipoprotein with Yx(FWY)xxD motif
MSGLVGIPGAPQAGTPRRSAFRLPKLRTLAFPAALLSLAVGLAACAGSATPVPAAPTLAAAAKPATTATDTSAGSGYGAPAAAATPSATVNGAAAVQLKVATGGPSGTYLADGAGMALYTYAKDTGSTSTCYGGCATAWPPLLASDASSVTAGSGVTGAIGVTKRTDGTTEVTYKGAPLYYFASDTKPGDVTGDGVGGVWHIATP